jgi:hypothetical protein
MVISAQSHVTSHSSQAATADRVLAHMDTERAHDQLVNSRLAYVSVSGGRYDAQTYTNDAEELGEELSRVVRRWVQSALLRGFNLPCIHMFVNAKRRTSRRRTQITRTSALPC